MEVSNDDIGSGGGGGAGVTQRTKGSERFVIYFGIKNTDVS